jgi:hypothetical protein
MNPAAKHFPGIFLISNSFIVNLANEGDAAWPVVPFRTLGTIMTNRRDFLRTPGLMVGAAAFTINPAKEAKAAIYDETAQMTSLSEYASISRSSRRS